MAEPEFKDHFSGVSNNYSQSRPHYPTELFDYLSSLTQSHELAWDCATGNGQAAMELAGHYSKVYASDASQNQLDQACQHPNIQYALASAENSGLKSQSIDLITVAQALHWFDLQAFATECKRVLKTNGVLAVWCYKRLSISPEIDKLITEFYFDEIGQYWPEERQMVENGYAKIELPFPEIKTPEFMMHANWTLQHLIQYLNTWSAVSKYKKQHKRNPIDQIEAQLTELWGNSDTREISWRIMLRVFKNS